MAGAMTGAPRKACILRFDSRIKGVIGEYEKFNKLNEIVKGFDAQASACTDVDSGQDLEHDELELIQQKRDIIDKLHTAAIVSALNTQAVTTSGPSCKDERYARLKPMHMSIPSPLEGIAVDLRIR